MGLDLKMALGLVDWLGKLLGRARGHVLVLRLVQDLVHWLEHSLDQTTLRNG